MTPISNSQVQSSARLHEIEGLLRLLDHIAHLPPEATTPQALAECERQVCREADRLVGLIVGEIMQASLDSEALAGQIDRLVDASTKPLKKDGEKRGQIYL